MAGQINRYKLAPIERWAEPVMKQRHLTHYLGVSSQQELDNVFAHLYAYNNQPTIDQFIKKWTKVREFDDDREIKWKVYGTVSENVPLYEARDEEGTVIGASYNKGNVGVGGAHFQLVFEKPMFYEREMIVGNLNEMYQFYILDEPIFEGSMAVYNVQLMYGAETGVPAERLLKGELFSVEFAPVEKEGSRGAGGIRYQNFTWMHNEWTTIRKKNKLYGNMKDRKFTNIPMYTEDKNGKMVLKDQMTWVYNEELIMNKEWRREKSNVICYSRSNRNSNGTYFNHGKSGNVIVEGDGLFAQMDYGNTRGYNTFGNDFSLKVITDSLLDFFEANNIPLQDRHVMCTTGSRGMMQVNQAINKDTSGWKFMIDGAALGAVKKVSNPVNQNSYAAGYQFTQAILPNGIVVDFTLDMSQDDRNRNKIEGPNGEGVMNSYTYNFFDLGSTEDPNIYLCQVAGQGDIVKYIPGIRNPFGIEFGQLATTDEDATQVEFFTQMGVCIVDPTRTMRIKPEILL